MPSFIFILIPGAGGSAWYWHLVVPMLKQRGHEAIPVALPAAEDTAGLPEYADAVVRCPIDDTAQLFRSATIDRCRSLGMDVRSLPRLPGSVSVVLRRAEAAAPGIRS